MTDDVMDQPVMDGASASTHEVANLPMLGIGALGGVLMVVGQFLPWANLGGGTLTGFIKGNEWSATVITVAAALVVLSGVTIGIGVVRGRAAFVARAIAIGAATGAALTAVAFYDSVATRSTESAGIWLTVAGAFLAAVGLAGSAVWTDQNAPGFAVGRYIAAIAGAGFVIGAMVQWTASTTNGIDVGGGRWYAGFVLVVGLYELLRAGLYDPRLANWMSRSGVFPAAAAALIPSLFFALAFVQQGLSGLGAGPWVVVAVAGACLVAEAALQSGRLSTS